MLSQRYQIVRPSFRPSERGVLETVKFSAVHAQYMTHDIGQVNCVRYDATDIIGDPWWKRSVSFGHQFQKLAEQTINSVRKHVYADSCDALRFQRNASVIVKISCMHGA